MISIIHPSRGRAIKSINNISNWFSNSTVPFEFILSLDEDDEVYKYKTYYPKDTNIVVNANRSAIDAINNAAKIAKGEILIVVSDDTYCELKGWDSFLLKWLAGKKDFICKVDDGIQPWIITMPIMDRTYYNRFGYIYHPDYQHMFCDTELTCVADLTGRKLTSNILFKHNHYSITKEQPDAVNKKADATWAQGEKLFLERYKRNFDLKK